MESVDLTGAMGETSHQGVCQLRSVPFPTQQRTVDQSEVQESLQENMSVSRWSNVLRRNNGKFPVALPRRTRPRECHFQRQKISDRIDNAITNLILDHFDKSKFRSLCLSTANCALNTF